MKMVKWLIGPVHQSTWKTQSHQVPPRKPYFLNHNYHKPFSDPEITELLQPWKAVIDVQATKVVGESQVRLVSSCYTSECTLGNLITDTMVYAVSYCDCTKLV